MIGHRYSGRSFIRAPAELLVPILLVAYGAGVIALLASGRLIVSQAGALLAAPILLCAAALRPEWVILVVLALPGSGISPVPPRQMTLLMVASLFGFLLQGRFRLGLATGIYPLLGLIALAMAYKANVPTEATVFADDLLKVIVYLALLMLAGFHGAYHKNVSIDAVVGALLIGIVASAILTSLTESPGGFGDVTNTPFRGKFAYLAAMGFGVTQVRLLLSRAVGRKPSGWDYFLRFAFLFLTAIAFVRVAWIAALLVLALAAKWARRKAYWVTVPVALVILLAVPAVGERIAPGGITHVTSGESLTRLTTGRYLLWEELWERGSDALPWGNGFGYVWALESEDVFGFEGQFSSEGNAFIYPHNDFLFLFVELGIVGFGLLLLFWGHLFATVRSLSRSRDAYLGYEARVLVPIVVTMLLVQLFDNGFAIRMVAERFFIVAGFIFGLRSLGREADRSGGSQQTPLADLARQ